MKEVLLRALTGSVFIAVIVGAIYVRWGGAPLVFAVFAGALTWEFVGLDSHRSSRVWRVMQALASGYLFTGVYGVVQYGWSEAVLAPYVFFLLYVAASELFRGSPDPLGSMSQTVFGQLYCGGSLSLLSFFEEGDQVLSVFVLVWVNDTVAYLTGSSLGRHAFFPSVSPKKSWEGFVGGAVGAVLAGQVLCGLLEVGLSPLGWLGLSVSVVLSSTAGDLLESLLKRRFCVKDSGHALPGHGGFLDRFDSVLFAIPASYIYFQLMVW
ncbi:MAG: phosphatidate cytidylyltransferase [Tannerellaceae bacterium]|jgi:phosphatidate cytidylyltransferase|nr:phosphatidate cytidylyltransferase [Tannerellaceae bacterium]